MFKDFFALGATAFAILILSGLRHPYSHRSRWGKNGKGAPMSVLSIVVVATWLVALSAAMIAYHFTELVPPTLEIDVVFSGFCAAIVCSGIDALIYRRAQKMPNQPPEPTRPFGPSGSS
jgi:hypothetical protein